jgi:hypothetical protein
MGLLRSPNTQQDVTPVSHSLLACEKERSEQQRKELKEGALDERSVYKRRR